MHERYRVRAGGVEEEARERAFRFLDAHRRPDSWVGEMSSSALATAISCLALQLQPEAAMLRPSIRSGLDWLAETRQADGGWGDGVIDASNMNATSLTTSVLQYCDADRYSGEIRDGLRWVERAGGFRALNDPRVVSLSGPCRSVYALAGFVDWSQVRKLPTEMILLPRRIRRTVSTTFPAFLSLSLMHEHFSPAPPWRRPLRRRAAREARGRPPPPAPPPRRHHPAGVAVYPHQPAN